MLPLIRSLLPHHLIRPQEPEVKHLPLRVCSIFPYFWSLLLFFFTNIDSDLQMSEDCSHHWWYYLQLRLL